MGTRRHRLASSSGRFLFGRVVWRTFMNMKFQKETISAVS